MSRLNHVVDPCKDFIYNPCMGSSDRAKGLLWKVTPKERLSFKRHCHELWRYRGLLYTQFRGQFRQMFMQTVLGPLWFFIPPILDAYVNTFLFAYVAGIKIAGLPYLFFYLTGAFIWSIFLVSFNTGLNAFTKYGILYNQVYFPRIIPVLSATLLAVLRSSVVVLPMIGFYIYYVLKGFNLFVTWELALFPLVVLGAILLGLGIGLFIASASIRYRDVRNVINYFIRFLRYVSPVVYPVSLLKGKSHIVLAVIHYNPLTYFISAFRLGFIGYGSVNLTAFFYAFGVAVLVFILGYLIFLRGTRTYADFF